MTEVIKNYFLDHSTLSLTNKCVMDMPFFMLKCILLDQNTFIKLYIIKQHKVLSLDELFNQALNL